MSHGNHRRERNDSNNRNENRSVHADPKAVRSRQHEAHSAPPAPSWEWITDKEKLEAACLDILRGKPGLYPIFGIQLAVEERTSHGETYPVVVFCDAKYGEEGQGLCGLIKPGFFMSPGQLTWTIGKDTKFKSQKHAALTLALLIQPEMQLAREQFAREEKEKERARRQEEADAKRQTSQAREDLIAKLRDKLVQGPATETGTPVKSEAKDTVRVLSDILSATSGAIEHDGITIFVTRAPEKGYAVRVKNVPEGHPLEEVARKNIFALQDALHYADDRTSAPADRTGNSLLGYQLRTYLRGELMKEGVILTPPTEGSAHPNGNGAHTAPEETPAGKDRGVEASSAS